MKRVLIMLASLTTATVSADPVIVVHGGAGTIDRSAMTAGMEAEYHAALRAALEDGMAVLERDGPALDAVTAAVITLEDSPLFNAGRGSVFSFDGRHELDASIMDGRSGRAGAVGGVRLVRNPIVLARRVMEASPHVFLAGSGAEEFALEQGIEFAPREYFHTEQRWEQWRSLRDRKQAATGPLLIGTVGAVVLDGKGNLAAGTSTGGMTGKRWGRLGDSPVIGAGTWAGNADCAVSATGHGEYFIRLAVAHEICARLRLAGVDLETAAHGVIHESLGDLGGTGGVIAVDRDGRVAMPFNTDGMYRGVLRAGESPETAIY